MVVDGNIVSFAHRLSLPNDFAKLIKLGDINIIELCKFIIVEETVFKTVLNDAFNVNTLELLKHVLGVELIHLTTIHGDYRAEIKELSK